MQRLSNHLWAILALSAASGCRSCSNFYMNTNGSEFRLSVRTMDLGSFPGQSFALVSVPRDSKVAGETSRFGYVGHYPKEKLPITPAIPIERLITGGMNEAGLSCDMQTLDGTRFPVKAATGRNLYVALLCEWALAMFANVAELRAGLANTTVWGDELIMSHLPSHFVMRDATAASLVVEFMHGGMQLYDDHNDGGFTGYGVMTNEPPFPYHVANVRQVEWKKTMARSAVTIPGAFYPDERFVRIHMLKSAMSTPATYPEAVMQAVHVLNSITVPMGQQMGTDSGHNSGEGKGDHTLYGSIYDHANRTLYWRTAQNMNLQRLRLADLDLMPGARRMYLPVVNELPWFNDARSSFTPN